MKANQKTKIFGLSAAALLVLVSCGGGSSSSSASSSPNPSSSSGSADPSSSSSSARPAYDGPKYEDKDDGEIFDYVLSDYQKLHDDAMKIADDSERYVKYAEAEAELLDQAVMSPYSTQGGAYAITRAAPRTVPYVLYGNDEDRLKGLVAITGENKFVSKEERAELLQQWTDAKEGRGTYDPAAYLKAKGYSLATEYTTSFSTAPATMDILNTSEASDTEVLVNMIESFVEYDNLGVLHGALAVEKDGKPFEVSDDGLTYTFTIRDDAKWVTNEGAVYASVTGDDFVAGFQHMLDAKAGLEWLFEGVVEGVTEYVEEGGSWKNVGYKADGQKVSITLCKPENFFVTRLVYSCSSPLNRAFFLSKGGAFGVDEFNAAKAADGYAYGLTNHPESMLYNSAYYPIQWDTQASGGTIVLKKNQNYYNADKVTMDKLTWVYDGGENMEQTYNQVKSGVFAGLTLNAANGTLEWAKRDGFFASSSYVTDTNAVSYMSGLNLNRKCFGLENGSCQSSQNEAQKKANWYAMKNKNFRKGILHAWDRATFNAVSRGEDLKTTNLRNIYTAPEFVSTTKELTVDGVKFPKGTAYGTLVQHFLDKKGTKVTAKDGVDGWYNKEEARKCIAAAKEELGDLFPAEGVTLEVLYYTGNEAQTANAQAFKQIIEDSIGDLGVHISLIAEDNQANAYAVGYRAKTGADLGSDIFYGSGWGPDYADPSSYLDTFAEGGYMVKNIGITL